MRIAAGLIAWSLATAPAAAAVAEFDACVAKLRKEAVGKGIDDKVFDTALAANPSGSQGDVTILIGDNNAISMITDSDWPLDSLARERGAKAAYRVMGASNGAVRVEGREGYRRCVMETASPARTARLLLGA